MIEFALLIAILVSLWSNICRILAQKISSVQHLALPSNICFEIEKYFTPIHPLKYNQLYALNHLFTPITFFQCMITFIMSQKFQEYMALSGTPL